MYGVHPYLGIDDFRISDHLASNWRILYIQRIWNNLKGNHGDLIRCTFSYLQGGIENNKNVSILVLVPCIFCYFVQWPTNSQLIDKSSHSSYMFRHYRVIPRVFVVSTLPSYTSMSNALVGNHHSSSFSNLSDDRSKASSKTMPPHSAI